MASVWTRLGFGGSRRAARARRAVLRRAAIASAAFGTLVAGTAAGLWYQLFRRPLPKTRGRLRAMGLSAAVEIRRDRWGVPHIRASARRDLWFAQGLCHGQDRLWQLDLYRRMASGRLSEIGERELLRADRARELGPELAARLDPSYPTGHPVVTSPGGAYSGDGIGIAEQIDRVRDTLGLAVEASGSNNWVVDGSRTASGRPLLA